MSKQLSTKPKQVQAARDVTEADRDWLASHGVSDRSLADQGLLGACHVAMESGTYQPEDSGQRCFIQRVPDWGGTADLVAWLPARPATFATRRNAAWCIGLQDIDKAAFDGEPLHVYPTPLHWLAAPDEQYKLCVLDWGSAWLQLSAVERLIVRGVQFGEYLERRLIPPRWSRPAIAVEQAAA